MILICHLLFGAFLVSKIQFLPLAFLLAFLSHYLLDFIPHQEYSIKNIKQKLWRKSCLDFLKVFLDVLTGTFLIFIFSKNFPLALLGGFFAILPDGFDLLSIIFKIKFFGFQQKLQFLSENKKISLIWKILSQLVVVSLIIFFLTH